MDGSFQISTLDIDSNTKFNVTLNDLGKFFVNNASVDAAGATMDTDANVGKALWTIDEDDMESASKTKVPTQSSVKAYVDANTGNTFSEEDLNKLSGDSQTTYGGHIVTYDKEKKEWVKSSPLNGKFISFFGVAGDAGDWYTQEEVLRPAVAKGATSTKHFGFVVDEDDMKSNSPSKIPTQQSVVAYIEAKLNQLRKELK